VSARDEKGRFVKGQSGNPKGRPPKAREERYYEIALQAVTFKQWKAIIKKAAKDAERGDASARRFLADYLLGRPQQYVDVTSGGERLPSVMIYLPEVDGVETESGSTGEVPS
jgi:hypothetical protein